MNRLVIDLVQLELPPAYVAHARAERAEANVLYAGLQREFGHGVKSLIFAAQQ